MFIHSSADVERFHYHTEFSGAPWRTQAEFETFPEIEPWVGLFPLPVSPSLLSYCFLLGTFALENICSRNPDSKSAPEGAPPKTLEERTGRNVSSFLTISECQIPTFTIIITDFLLFFPSFLHIMSLNLWIWAYGIFNWQFTRYYFKEKMFKHLAYLHWSVVSNHNHIVILSIT